MGFFKRKPKKPEAPRLYKGRLIETKLYPIDGLWSERDGVLGPRGRKNFWCELRQATQKSGKYAGSTYVQAWVEGVMIGDIPPRHLVSNPELIEAFNSGINGATVLLERSGSSGGVEATLRLGNHEYMPRPYWE